MGAYAAGLLLPDLRTSTVTTILNVHRRMQTQPLAGVPNIVGAQLTLTDLGPVLP